MRNVFLLAAAAVCASAQSAMMASLMTRDLPEFPGKEAIMITVTYGPGQESAPHRHNAHVFVYVLEGSVEMRLAGGKAVTLGPGETFYEKPTDIHLVSRNASESLPARILVTMIKDKGKPISEPVNRK
jgi:quercetin dioxygenase-like cupin family protein